MLKRSIEVRGATDSGDSDISGISTPIKRRIGGRFHFFQLREYKRRENRRMVLVPCVCKEDSSKLKTYQESVLVKGQMGEKVLKKDHPSVTGPWSNPA